MVWFVPEFAEGVDNRLFFVMRIFSSQMQPPDKRDVYSFSFATIHVNIEIFRAEIWRINYKGRRDRNFQE